jgi:hypothetical protein
MPLETARRLGERLTFIYPESQNALQARVDQLFVATATV